MTVYTVHMERTKAGAAKRNGKQFVIWLPDELADQVRAYRFANEFETSKAAIVDLLRRGLATRDSTRGKKTVA